MASSARSGGRHAKRKAIEVAKTTAVEKLRAAGPDGEGGSCCSHPKNRAAGAEKMAASWRKVAAARRLSSWRINEERLPLA